MTQLRRARSLAIVLCLGVGAGLFSASGVSAASPPARTQPGDTVWLCRPGLADNPCESDLTTTVIRGNGSQNAQAAAPAKKPPVDCFYVYPTVSAQPTINANLNIDPELIAVAEYQAARFSQVCRVYAPVYPQLTIAAIGGRATPEARDAAYAGVLSAWKEYLQKYSRGRGVVFIGHSQGAGMLTRLLSTEIDPNAKLRRRTVSALLLGGNVTVAKGKRVGGDFQRLPACESTKQTGCVVAYSMFGETPPPNALFGRVSTGPSTGSTQDPSTLQVLCTNPASLKGTGMLRPYLRTSRFPGPIGAVAGDPPSAPTPWVAFPNLYTARCEQSNDLTWLQVTDVSGPTDPRPRTRGTLPPTWGLHLGDVNLALGNLVDLARTQGAAYRR
jgi:Protein of unknown function (DUF3089)